MDYHSMKRRELQALCKEHNIPANSATSVMADKLSALLNEKQKPATRQRTCMKSSAEAVDENEPAVLRRQAKKVRFSPNNELVEYELRSGKKEKALVTEMKPKGKAVAKKVDKPVVDNDNTVELIDDSVQIPVKLTRSRVQMLGKVDVVSINEKKRGRRAGKDVEKRTDTVKETEGNLGKVTRSKAHTLEKGGVVQLDENKQRKRTVKDVENASESGEEPVVTHARVTRSKAQTLEDGVGPDLNPRVKKKSRRQVAKITENVELSKEIVDIPARVTRSRGQTLKDDIGNTVANPQAEKKRTRRETKVADLSNNSTVVSSNATLEDNQELPRRKSLRNREVEVADEDGGQKLRHGRQKKRSQESIAEVPEHQYHADRGSRRSKRNDAKVEDSTVLNQNVSKVKVVNHGKVTKSKVHLAMKSSEGNSESKSENEVEVQREFKMVQQLEEPLEHAGRKNAKRRKSVIQPENTEAVLHLEEPVNRPARKDTRRKSVMQKAEGKGTDKPLVGKREMVKEAEMVEAPRVGTRKSVGRKQSKEQSGNLSTIDEGLEDKKNVSRSGKELSENEMNAVAGATRSHGPRKRRGDPIIEDQTFEIEYASVDESPRRSTRGATKSEGKVVTYLPQSFVAKKLQESSLKTPMSRMDNHSAVESAFVEGHQRGTNRALRSGAIIRDNSSETRAIKSECTPAIDESLRRVTRSAIKSERDAVGSLLEKADKKKQPSQSAIKEQPIGDAQLSSCKVAEFGPNPTVNEIPRQFIRSGIKHGGNSASKLFEKAAKKKQPSQSTHDSQMSSPEVAEVRPNPDVTSSRIIKNSNSKKRKKSSMNAQIAIQADTIGVQSGTLKEAKGRMMQHLGDLSASESGRLPAKIAEENKISPSETAIVMENVSSLSGENASGVESHVISDGSYATARALGKEITKVACDCLEKSSVRFTRGAAKCETNTTPYLTKNLRSGKQRSPVDLPNFEDEPPSRPNLSDIKRMPVSIAQVAETTTDALSDGSHLQNQNQEVYVKSAILSEAEVQVAVSSVGKSVLNSARPEAYEKEMELTKSGSGSERLQIDEILKEPVVSVGKTVVMEESVDTSVKVITKGNNGDADNNCDSISYEAGSSAVCHASVQHSDVKRKLKEMEALIEPSITEGVKPSVADDGVYAQIEKGSEQDALTCKDTLQNPSVGKHEVVDNSEHNDEDRTTSAQKLLVDEHASEDNRVHGSIDMLKSPDMGNRGVADGVDAQEMDSEWPPSTNNDICQSPVVGEHDVEPNRVDTTGQSTDGKLQRLVLDENDIKDDIVTAAASLAEHSEPSTGKNILHGLADDGVDAEQEPVEELEFDVVPSTGNEVREIPVLGKYDGEDGSFDASKECESDSMRSTAGGMLEVPVLNRDDVEDEGVNANKEHEYNPKPLTGDDVSDTLVSGKDDGFNMTVELEPVSEPSTANNILEIPFSGNGIDGGCDNAIDDFKSNLKPPTGNNASDTPVMGKDDGEDDGINVPKELEPDSEPSTAYNILEIPLSGNGIDGECDNAIDDLKSNLKPRTGNDVSDTHGMGKYDVEDDSINVPKELESDSEPSTANNTLGPVLGNDVANNLGDIDGVRNAIGVMDTKNDISFCGNEQKIIETSELDEGVQSKELENVSPDTSNERGTKEAETTAENDHALGDKKEHMVATLDHDLDRDKSMDDSSTHGVDEFDSQLVGNIRAHENSTREESSPIMCRKEQYTIDDTVSDQLVGDKGAHESAVAEKSLPVTYKKEESPVDDTVLDPPTYFKDDNKNMQEESQNTSTSVDWGNYSFGIDEFQKRVSANESDDVLGGSLKDDRVLDRHQTSARASSSIKESSSPVADLIYSLSNVEKASSNVADGKSNQNVDVMKANANVDVTDAFFNWSEDSSLKDFFTTPTTTRTSHVKDRREDAAGFAFPDDRCEDIGRNETAADDFHHQWENEPLRVFNDETQDTAADRSSLGGDPESDMFGVPNFEDFSHKYFDDREVDGSSDMLGKNEHFDFKDGQVNEIKEYDSLSEAAGMTHHDASGLKDNSIRSGEFGKKEETQLKGSETGNDLAFDKGTRET